MITELGIFRNSVTVTVVCENGQAMTYAFDTPASLEDVQKKVRAMKAKIRRNI